MLIILASDPSFRYKFTTLTGNNQLPANLTESIIMSVILLILQGIICGYVQGFYFKLPSSADQRRLMIHANS